MASASSSEGRRLVRRSGASSTALDDSTRVAAGGPSPARLEATAMAPVASAALRALALHQHRRLQLQLPAPPRSQSEAHEEALTSSPDSEDQSSHGSHGFKRLRLAPPVAGMDAACATPLMLSSVAAPAAHSQGHLFVPIGHDEPAETADPELDAQRLLAAQPWGYGGAAFLSCTPLVAPLLAAPPAHLHQQLWQPHPGSRWGAFNENDSRARVSPPAVSASESSRSGTSWRESQRGYVDTAGLERGGIASFPTACAAGAAAALVGALDPSTSHWPPPPHLPERGLLQRPTPPAPLRSAALATGRPLSTAIARAASAFAAIIPSPLGGSVRQPGPVIAAPAAFPLSVPLHMGEPTARPGGSVAAGRSAREPGLPETKAATGSSEFTSGAWSAIARDRADYSSNTGQRRQW